MKKLIFGVGLNDADYVVRPTVGGVQKAMCPYYRKWTNMLQRCYDTNYQKRQTTYTGCEVCDEWKTFSKFRAWMETQDWKDKELDKDFLIKGNKLYSPERCCFISKQVNNFCLHKRGRKGEEMLGVCTRKGVKRDAFVAFGTCKDKTLNLGTFKTEIEAHKAWKTNKHAQALLLAEQQSDLRIVNILRNLYAD